MPLHLCFLCHEYPPEPHGGVGTVVQALGRALVARGHRVTVLGVSRTRPGESDDHGVRVVRLPHARVRGTGLLVHGRRLRRRLASLHREHPIDVVEGDLTDIVAIVESDRSLLLEGEHGLYMNSYRFAGKFEITIRIRFS